jgi:hypothetical protein
LGLSYPEEQTGEERRVERKKDEKCFGANKTKQNNTKRKEK